MDSMSGLFQLTLPAPKRTSFAVIAEDHIQHALFGDTLRRQLLCLAHLYDPRIPLALDFDETGLSADRVAHPIEHVLTDGPRPDPRFCFQRLRALWLLAENRGGQITNDPVLPFRHQAALLQYLIADGAPQRVLIADEVGLGKTVEAGLLIRHKLRNQPRARILYATLGGLVANVLEEFQRLDLPGWHFYANLEDQLWKTLNAFPAVALTADTRLVVASIHKLFDSNRWLEQHGFLGRTRFDFIIIDECHTLRAYGPAADSQQVWFRSIRQLLEEHLTADGRVLFLSATPHQGNREVFLNLIALCVGSPLNASGIEKAQEARGRIVFRVKEHVRDWDNKRIFPSRDVRSPRLAEPPANYQHVLKQIAEHFNWIAANTEGPQARAVGFVKSQALQYAASSLRAGFAYLLRRLVRHHPTQTAFAATLHWAERLMPYRNNIDSPAELLEEWLSEFRLGKPADDDRENVHGELSEDVGPEGNNAAELPRLLALLKAFDALFDDPEAGTKFNTLFELVDEACEPIVVFSQAVDTVYELEARLKQRGCELYRLTGDMSTDARLTAIRGFRTSTTLKRLLLSSAAGGIGINLQVARVVVHFDLPWNPMVLEQRVGRVHRIGSSRTILVETILLRGSREAEVFERITQRLQEIVVDLSNDPIEREALFRRILASLESDSLRELFSGEKNLDAVGAAVEDGRRAVNEVDNYMLELKAKTNERHGRATMDRLIQFLNVAEPDFKKVDSSLYAVLTESHEGELHQVQRMADVYSFGVDGERIVFDRTAASYLGLRRDQTGGLGNAFVDPLIRSAIDLTNEPKPRSSAWVVPLSAGSSVAQAGDIIYFALDASRVTGSLADPHLRAWCIRKGYHFELDEAAIEEFVWETPFSSSRKAGDFPTASGLGPQELLTQPAGIVRFPIAAIGIRERSDRQ